MLIVNVERGPEVLFKRFAGVQYKGEISVVKILEGRIQPIVSWAGEKGCVA